MKRLFPFALLLLGLLSCNKDKDADIDVPQQEVTRGILTGITRQKGYTPTQFVNSYTNVIGGTPIGILSAKYAGVNITPAIHLATDMLVARQGLQLDQIFRREQKRLNAVWEMQAYSITFKSIGYKDEPIELSAMVAFPNSLDPHSAHELDGISVYNHARNEKNDYMPSVGGDVMMMRAFFNQLVVIPDQEGGGVSLEHYFAQTENDRNAQQTIDCISAALQLIDSLGVKMKDGYQTQNFGISLGGETCIGLHHYLETKATPEERKLVNLKATFGGAGIIRPNIFFSDADKGLLSVGVAFNLALNILEGIVELSPSEFGGYDARSDLMSPELFEMPSPTDPTQTYMEARRYLSFGYEDIDSEFGKFMTIPFQTIFCDEMRLPDNSFDYTSAKTKALFSYLEKCDLGTGWNPEHQLTLVWSYQDEAMDPSMHQSAYDNLRRMPDGSVCKNMKKYVYDLSDMPQISAQVAIEHMYLCILYFITCITNEYPEDLGE